MSDFRTEIVETSKSRTDFLKWKLIGTAGLGAVGFGLPINIAGGYLVVALIPLLCFYVDMISRHIALRILVVGNFLRLQGAGEQAAYEAFAQVSRDEGVFDFEDFALSWSTVALSLLVFVLGLLKVTPGGGAGAGILPLLVWAWGQIDLQKLAPPLFMISGVLGVALTWANHKMYKSHMRRLDALVADGGAMAPIVAMAHKPFPPSTPQ